MEVYPAEKWMVIGTEHAGTSVLRVLIHSMHFCFPDRARAIPDQHIVQHQPGQGMEGMTPGRNRRRYTKGEARLSQQSPGTLIASPTQVQIGAQNNSFVAHRADQVPGLELATGGAKPAMARWTPGIEMRTDHTEPVRSE